MEYSTIFILTKAMGTVMAMAMAMDTVMAMVAIPMDTMMRFSSPGGKEPFEEINR